MPVPDSTTDWCISVRTRSRSDALAVLEQPRDVGAKLARLGVDDLVLLLDTERELTVEHDFDDTAGAEYVAGGNATGSGSRGAARTDAPHRSFWRDQISYGIRCTVPARWLLLHLGHRTKQG